MIRQGDIYWLELEEPSGSGPGYRHPYVVVQNNIFNLSRIRTVVLCALSSNLKRAEAPGNVLLDEGEAGLRRRSVVNVSQVYTADRGALVEKVGTLSRERVQEIISGLCLLLEPRDI